MGYKYKNVIVLRELQNKAYIDIANLCIKDYEINLGNESITLDSSIDFLDLNLRNSSEQTSYVNITYLNNENKETIQLNINKFGVRTAHQESVKEYVDLFLNHCLVYPLPK
jgi:hypothetical protein